MSRTGAFESASLRMNELGGFFSGQTDGKTKREGVKPGGSGGIRWLETAGASMGESPSDQNGQDEPGCDKTGFFQRREGASTAWILASGDCLGSGALFFHFHLGLGEEAEGLGTDAATGTG